MSLTLKNYSKELSKDLLLLAEKNQVRECDETALGSFIAYVDEGSNSFDVSITVLPNYAIGKSTCDCKNNLVFCRHKTALLIHIAKDKKTKDTLKLKKKESKAEALLEQAEFSELKDWVKGLLQKNKDIELAFTHHFWAKNKYYTTEEVINLIKDAVKATGCNKKNIDATQVKRLVELWLEVLQPVAQQYQSNATDEMAFESFHIMLENCLQIHRNINSSSIRIAKYVEDILQKSESPLNDLQNDEAWYKATGFFIDNIPDGNNRIRMHYLLHLQNVIAACGTERRENLINLLAGQFKKNALRNLINGPLYTKTIFGIIENYNLVPRYYQLFKPLHFENEFNQKLINLLIENNHLELAEKYCAEQVKANFQEQYNIPYLKLLKEIYTIQKDETKLAGVLTILFPHSFDFDDYLFIIGRLQEDEKKSGAQKFYQERGTRHTATITRH